MAFSVLDFTDRRPECFAQAILDAKRKIHLCPVCQNLTDQELCNICRDETRDVTVICVVEDVRVLMAIEGARVPGYLSCAARRNLAGLGRYPDKIRIAELLERLKDDRVSEVIIATDPDVEGEATAMYIAKLLRPLGVKVSRLAYGVPVGGDLEYADEVTLSRALDGRRDF